MAMLGGFISSVGVSPAVVRMSADGDDIIVGDADTTFTANSEDNIAIGLNALDSTVDAALKNIAIGTSSLTTLTTGDENVAIGYESMNNAIGGSNNTCVGHTAGRNIAAGDDNVCIGRQAGYTLTNASNTVLIGYNAGDSINNTTAIGTVAIGH